MESILTSAIAARYELLRGAVLGEALPIEARSGLALLLRRGMWSWARALAAATNSPREQACASSIAFPARCGYDAAVHVLASIVASIHDRRSS